MKAPARAGEREAVLKLIEARICFDQLEKKRCDHPDCYALLDLQRIIESGAHLER